MAKRFTREDFGLMSVDELFTTQEERDDRKKTKLEDLELRRLDSFEDHPYQVKDDEDMAKLIKSINDNGLLSPLIVREKEMPEGEEARYEIISGHRRKHACEMLGMETVKCRIVDLNRDAAVICMVDSNLHRSKILPSEKAKAYQMKMNALTMQGTRNDLFGPAEDDRVDDGTSAPMVHRLPGQKSRDIIAQEAGESREQVRRYIRLNYLIPELLEFVDQGKMAMRPAVELSYLTENTQELVNYYMRKDETTPTHDQSIRIRKAEEAGELTEDTVRNIILELKPNQKDRLAFRSHRILKLMPADLPLSKREDFVVDAVSYYREHHYDRQHSRNQRDELER